MTASQVAKHFGVSQPTISNKIKTIKRSRGGKFSKEEIANFQSLYDAGMSCGEIAKVWGVSKPTVSTKISTHRGERNRGSRKRPKSPKTPAPPKTRTSTKTRTSAKT